LRLPDLARCQKLGKNPSNGRREATTPRGRTNNGKA
jgi:hypothetical protein